ncbi:neuropeptide CCHamide-1 receptor-like [Macrosteles quadrilineatus]|uniref:neuropeptide CCHamide-1 receptor-like n=1 Tax=Macrosteles quadrilineatus TaxID=74068 RepID=UPI0023E2749C|nr:neuropeptide CCHamide-1 receptor-like [Macrosteles quadrilineatus]
MLNISAEEEAFFNATSAGIVNNSALDIPPYEERPETYYVPVLFAIIFLVGVVGNGTVVIIFIRHKKMRSVPNTYIFSLAIGDLLVIISCVPFTSIIYTVPSWPFGEIVCKLSETSKDISIGVSVFTLTALSAERFFAIVDPIRKQLSYLGVRGATRVALAIWGLAIFFSLPAAFGAYVREVRENDTSIVICYPFPEEYGIGYAKGVILARFLIHYTVPLSIIAFFYIMIARHLIISTKNIPGGLQPHQARQIKGRKKVAKTVLAFVIIFAVCFFPNHVFFLWFYWFSKNPEQNYNAFWHHLRIVGFCLTFVNSCINPIALYCVTGTFRKHFDRYLFCCWKHTAVHRGRSSQRRHTGTRKWDSTTLHLHHSTVRRPGNTAECTVTTFMNGGVTDNM